MSRSIKSPSIEHLREEYRLSPLDKKNLNEDPFKQFDLWFSEVIEANIQEPNAMGLATASMDGIPSSRTVLLKKSNKDGFVFFTNYTSRKAHDIAENPRASLTFFWKELERQVIVEGLVEKTSVEESSEYFSKRPRTSQLGAWASLQSHVINDRQCLDNEYEKYESLYEGIDIPLPLFWGGYRVIPYRFEFWQGRRNRLHDRFQYVFSADGHWHIDRLSP